MRFTLEQQIEILEDYLTTSDAVLLEAVQDRLWKLKRQKHEQDNSCTRCGRFGFSCICTGDEE